VDSGAPLCSGGPCKRVFITSVAVPIPVGGASLSDQKCQKLADGRGLGATWKAWISDNTGSAAARLTHANVPYRLLDGTLIANNWIDLTDGALAHSIDVDETVTRLTGPAEAWTGTDTTGAAIKFDTCANWSNATASLPYGYVGVSDRADYGWTQVFEQFCNHSDPRLYCFEQ
jgi:hypothetical protein